MADILASVSVVLGAEVSQFRAAMANARKDLEGLRQFGEGMKSVGDGLTRYLTLPLAGIGAASVAASAKMESLRKGIEAITAADLGKQGITGLAGLQAAASQAGDRLKVLETIAKAPGIGFEQAVAGDIRLRAVGISATQSAKSLKEFANAIATTGGGASEFDRVTTQLAQLSAKGKVLSQDLRPIIEAAPAVSQALLKLYGTIDSETISASLTKQGKSSQDFIAVLTDELAKLPRVTGGLANAFENLQQTAVQSAAKLGDGISKALNLPGLTEGLATGIERLGNGFAALAPGTQKLIVGLGVAAAAAGPLLVGIGTLGAALPAITAGFATLGITSAAALGPIGIAAVAIAAGAALIIDHWDELTAYFSSSGEGGRVFSDLATSVTNSISQISDAFSALNGGGNFGDLVSAPGVFKAAFRDVATGITAASNVIGGAIGGIVKLLSGDLPGAAAQGQRALLGLVQPLANVFGYQLRLAEATQGVREKFDALAVATPGLAAVLNNLSGITPFPVVNLGAATRTLGLLENLKQQLKDVQEQRDKETNVASITADNARIISLQKQIAALEGTDKAAKKLRDTYAEVQKSLADVGRLSLALGDQYNYLKSRQSATESGIKKLVEAGYSPASIAVQRLVADLRHLNTTLGDNNLLMGRSVEGSEKLFETPKFELPKLPKFELPQLQGTLPDYTKIFKDAASRVAAGGGELVSGLEKISSQSFQAILDFNTGTESLLQAFPAQAFAQIGQSIGDALASGASAIDALGQGVLKAMGQFLSEFGRLVLLKGAADVAFGNVAQGLAELAAGTALVAGAGLVGGAGGGVARGAASAAISTPSPTHYGQNSNSTQKIVVEVVSRLRAGDLVAVGRGDAYRNRVGN